MATVTIGQNTTDTYAGCADVQIRESASSSNYNGGDPMEMHKYGSGDHANLLIAFSGIASIPAGSTITDAKIWIKLSGDGGGTPTYSAQRLLRNWLESQATWNVWTTGNNWTTAGALSDGNDRSATVAATGSVGGSSIYYSFTGANLITEVQNWLDGVNSNYGVVLERTDGANDSKFKRFTSSDGANGSRPYLEVTYTAGGGGGSSVKTLAALGVG